MADRGLVGEVLEAASVTEAIEQHGNTSADLSLLDIKMPGLNGIDAVPVLHRCFKSARMLIVSGDMEASIERAADAAGVQGYLPKSAPADEIAIACWRALNLSAGQLEVTMRRIKRSESDSQAGCME